MATLLLGLSFLTFNLFQHVSCDSGHISYVILKTSADGDAGMDKSAAKMGLWVNTDETHPWCGTADLQLDKNFDKDSSTKILAGKLGTCGDKQINIEKDPITSIVFTHMGEDNWKFKEAYIDLDGCSVSAVICKSEEGGTVNVMNGNVTVACHSLNQWGVIKYTVKDYFNWVFG